MSAFCPPNDPLFDFLRVKFVLWESEDRTQDALEAELPNKIYQTKVAECSAAFLVEEGDILRNNNKNPPIMDVDIEWIQPARCKDCIWGRLEGTSQFCSLPRCVLEEKAILGTANRQTERQRWAIR